MCATGITSGGGNFYCWALCCRLAVCPPTADGQEAEKTGHTGGKNKRLPRDIKMKLAKVARLSVSSISLFSQP